jgi:hypothetical protein
LRRRFHRLVSSDALPLIFEETFAQRGRPLTTNTRPVPWDDKWHTVTLVRDVASGRIAVFFDDPETPLMEAIDKTFTRGCVGIGSFDDMNDFTAVKVLGRNAEAGK